MSATELNGELLMVGKEDGVWKVTAYDRHLSEHETKQAAVEAAKEHIDQGCIQVWTASANNFRSIGV